MASVVFDTSEFDGLIQKAVDVAIQRMKDERPKDEAGTILWDKREAAKRLGVSVSTLDRLRNQGLPAVKIDGKVLFRPKSLDCWAASNESPLGNGG